MGNGEQYGGGFSGHELAQQIKDLAEQCRQDREATRVQIGQLMMANDLVTVIRNGFISLDERLAPVVDIPAQLAPLRDLAPKRFQLPADIDRRIAAFFGPMSRPEFGGGGLGIPQSNVPFIGQGQAPPPPLPQVANFAEIMNLLRPANPAFPPGGAATPQRQPAPQGRQTPQSQSIQQGQSPLGGEIQK